MRIPAVTTRTCVRVAIYAISLIGSVAIAVKTQGRTGAVVGVAFGIGVGVFLNDVYLRLRERRRG